MSTEARAASDEVGELGRLRALLAVATAVLACVPLRGLHVRALITGAWTRLAKENAHAAILSGHSVLFVSAADLLLDLAAQESASRLERCFRFYAKIGLLIVDEVGFLAFDNRNADLLVQVVSRRYEKKRLVLTTNLAFKGWHTIFPIAICATALVERGVHHADTVTIEGESYRLRESQNDPKERRAKRSPK